MHLTRLLRERTDAELSRVTREGIRWNYMQGWYDAPGAPGCLLCHLFDNHSYADYGETENIPHAAAAEGLYMGLAETYGDEAAGALIARLARRELGRRAIEAAYAALCSSDVEAETEKVS